jgi:hypothetical protein
MSCFLLRVSMVLAATLALAGCNSKRRPLLKLVRDQLKGMPVKRPITH